MTNYGMQNKKYKYERIKLPYALNDLEWIISFKTMNYHYEILHKNYEIKLDEVLRGTKLDEQFPTLEELMENWERLPAELKDDVRFFGGGLINHNFFFAHLTKFKPKQKEYEQEEKISLALLNFIQAKFTNLEKLKKELVKSTLKIRGSGWTWLVLNKERKLEIINTANQDAPWSLHCRPLIAIDVWEHAYQFDYGTNREEYVKNLLNHLLNWEYISELYQEYTASF